MFEALPNYKPDPILELMFTFRNDGRTEKVDLGVGVYKNKNGETTVMRAVKEAEQRLHDTQASKVYVSPAGDASFCEAMRKLVFGANYDAARIRSIQTPGGSGALRVLADMLHTVNPSAKTWISEPTWPNHIPLLQSAGHDIARHPYYDANTNEVDFDAMMSTIGKAKTGDILILHGCCHNPTGADLDEEQWRTIADFCVERNVIPFVDLAYQGFGDGLEEDVHGIRILADKVPEMVVAASCSKNLALYRDRVGAAHILGTDSENADKAIGLASTVARSMYSMPPDHGAALASLIFHDDALSSAWKSELDEMRGRIQTQRQRFSDALRKRSNSDQFDYIAKQRGMFSQLPLSTSQIEALRDDHGVYIVGDGRINVAGLPEDGLDTLASRIIDSLV